MLLPLLALMTLQASQGFQTDTTFAVTQGTRLSIENQGGDIIVKTWERNQIRVQASHSRRTRVEIHHSGAVVSLEADAEHGPANMVDYEITVPTWMALNLEGMYATVSVTGSRAAISVETLDGDISVDGGTDVKLTSVQGHVSVKNAKGRVELNSVSESIDADQIDGDIVAETVSGDIVISRSTTRSVEIQTVSGELIYDGRIIDGGHYSLLTHSGNIAVSVAEGANATIATAIGSGDVRATFTLPNSERPSRRRQTFRLGSGSATVELESFSGSINLMRPAEMAARIERILARRDAKDKQKHKNENDDDDDSDRHMEN